MTTNTTDFNAFIITHTNLEKIIPFSNVSYCFIEKYSDVTHHLSIFSNTGELFTLKDKNALSQYDNYKTYLFKYPLP